MSEEECKHLAHGLNETAPAAKINRSNPEEIKASRDSIQTCKILRKWTAVQDEGAKNDQEEMRMKDLEAKVEFFIYHSTPTPSR